MRDMVVNLVKNVSEKMKGFSRQETIAYYTDITKRAWEQVEAADTPEVKSAKFEEVMDWTMLDKNYGGRTQDVFRNMPIFIPTWWGHYDPGFGKGTAGTAGVPIPSVGGRSSLPGADFAASLATGVQTFSSKVVGNVTEFTSSITSVTNPAPKPTTSSTRGGLVVEVAGTVAFVHVPVPARVALVRVQVAVVKLPAQILSKWRLQIRSYRN